MAISITNVNSNISDTVLSYTLTFTGKTSYKVLAEISVNGTLIGSMETTGSTSTTVAFTAASLYSAATGHALAGAVEFRVTDMSIDDIPIGTSARTGGNITINNRNSNWSLSLPTTGNPINIDAADPTNFSATWSRPHSAFVARLKISVWNGSGWTLVYNRTGSAISTNVDVITFNNYQYKQSFINAMNNASPRNLLIEMSTIFLANVDVDLSGTQGSTTVTNGIVKSFTAPSTIASFADFAVGVNPSVTLTLNSGTTVYHYLTFKVGATVIKNVFWGSTLTGTIAFSDYEWDVLLSAFAVNGLSTVVTLDASTYSDAGYTAIIGATQTDTATCSTTASVISPAIADFLIESATAGAFTLVSAYSRFTHVVNYKLGTTLIRATTNGAGVTFTVSEKDAIYGTFANNQTYKDFTVELLTYAGAKQIGATYSDIARGSVLASALVSASTPFDMTNTAPTINASNVAFTPGSPRFTHTLILKLGVLEYSFTGIVSGPYQTVLTQAQQQAIFSAVTNAKFATLTVQLITYFGSVQIGATDSSLTVRGDFPSLTPSFTINAPTEGNSAVTALITPLTLFIQLASKLNMSIVAPTLLYGATVASASILFEGSSYPITSGGSWAAQSIAIVGANKDTGLVISATVLDSRGYSYTTTRNVLVEPYSKPTVSFAIKRAGNIGGTIDPIGTFLRVEPNMAASPIPSAGNTKNTLKYTARARISGGTWYIIANAVSVPSLASVVMQVYQYITGTTVFAVASSYEVELSVTDGLFTTTPATLILATGDVILSMLQNGVGIKKVRQQGALDVHGDIYTDAAFISTLVGTAPMVVASTIKVLNLNVEQVDGYDAGNASGNIPVNNGTLNTNLNAEKVGGSTLAQIISAVLLAQNPIGTLLSNVSGTNPGTYIGGTWVAFGGGRVQIGMGSNGETNYTVVEATGGAQTHTLSGPEMPGHVHTGTVDSAGSHRHNTQGYWTKNTVTGTQPLMGRYNIPGDPVDTNPPILAAGDHTNTFTTAVAGSGAAHNNMQPYITVYMWKRTA